MKFCTAKYIVIYVSSQNNKYPFIHFPRRVSKKQTINSTFEAQSCLYLIVL